MRLKIGFPIFIAVLILGLGPPATAQPNLAQAMVLKGLAKIAGPTVRKNLRVNIDSTKEEFDENGNKKSHKTESKVVNGNLEVRGMDINELYDAFKTRYEFYIDDSQSTIILDETTYAIVRFKPKTNLRIKKTADQFINRTAGSIFINLDNFEILMITGAVAKPFDFTFKWFGLPLAPVSVYKFEFTVQYTTFNDMLVEQLISGEADYKVLSRGIEKFHNKITNHRMK